MTAATDQRAARKAQREWRELDKEVVQNIMRTPSGRKWVWAKLAEAGLFAESGPQSAEVSNYEKGRRVGALSLLSSVTRYAPAMYITMTQENTRVQLLADADADAADEEDEESNG